MSIHAVAVGEAVPRPAFDAVVHSVFDTAANLQLRQEDRMITILASDHYDLPQGIRVPAGSIQLRDLAVGSWARARNDVVSFASSSLEIDLRGVRIWHCPVGELQARYDAPERVAAWRQTWQMLSDHQLRAGAELVANDVIADQGGSALTRRLRAPLLGLVDAAAQLDAQATLPAVHAIVGLGSGVTPSGDDVLVGFMAGLWSAAARDDHRQRFARALGSILVQEARQTTAISRTYILHGARAQFSSSLSRLAQALASGDDLAGAASEAFRVGHTSGMDAATGLLLGVAAWSPEIRSVVRGATRQRTG